MHTDRQGIERSVEAPFKENFERATSESPALVNLWLDNVAPEKKMTKWVTFINSWV